MDPYKITIVDFWIGPYSIYSRITIDGKSVETSHCGLAWSGLDSPVFDFVRVDSMRHPAGQPCVVRYTAASAGGTHPPRPREARISAAPMDMVIWVSTELRFVLEFHCEPVRSNLVRLSHVQS